MIFEILKAADAKLVSLTNRSEKHGDDDVPAISAWFEMETDNTILDMLGDGALRKALYYGDDNQADVPGIPKTTPHLRTGSIDRVVVEQKAFEGWTLKLNHGIKDDEPVTFGNCKVDGFTAYPKARGTTILKFRVGTSDIDAASLGTMGMKVGQLVTLKLTAPKEKPAKTTDGGAPLFEGGDKPAAPRKPGAAERAAAGVAPTTKHKEPTKAEARKTAEEAFAAAPAANVSAVGAWPFPKAAPGEAPPQSVTTTRNPASSRTARGREKTKEALAAGASAAAEG